MKETKNQHGNEINTQIYLPVKRYCQQRLVFGAAIKSVYKFTCLPSFSHKKRAILVWQLNQGVILLAFMRKKTVNRIKLLVAACTKGNNE